LPFVPESENNYLAMQFPDDSRKPAAIVAAEVNRHVGATQSSTRLIQVGDLNPGDASQLSSCEATSSLRAFLSKLSRSAPTGKVSAFSRKYMASRARCSLRGRLLLRRTLIASSPRRISAEKVEELEPDDADDYGRKGFLRLYGRICSTNLLFCRS
jgi:hypothetical protein